jgi:hypothetical protein
MVTPQFRKCIEISMATNPAIGSRILDSWWKIKRHKAYDFPSDSIHVYGLNRGRPEAFEVKISVKSHFIPCSDNSTRSPEIGQASYGRLAMLLVTYFDGPELKICLLQGTNGSLIIHSDVWPFQDLFSEIRASK